MFINWPLIAATLFPNIGGWIAYFIIKKNQEWYEVSNHLYILRITDA
jgi:hypothetical protein